jgi:hypothetical protein
MINYVNVFFLRNPEVLNNLWKLREEFTDATIFADNSKFGIRVHKFILAAASPYFRVKLKKRRTVRLPEFSQDDLQMILEYIYKGNIQITADKFERFQEKAKLLSIDIQITRRKGNTSFETSLETSSETGSKTSTETSLETSSETSSKTGSETGSDTSSKTSLETSLETSSKTGSKTSSETSLETSLETSSETGSEPLRKKQKLMSEPQLRLIIINVLSMCRT